MPPVVVLQGFGVFGNHRVNPSERLVRDLVETYPKARASITGRVLDTSAAALAEIPTLLETYRPDVYLGVGLAAGRAAVAVERVALNLADYRIPDQNGVTLTEQPVVPGGPAAYWSTLPVTAIREAWRAADIPGYISNTAGTFLCNHAFYLAAHTVAARGLRTRVGFIHVPALVEQVATGSEPALPYQVLRTALVAALDTITTTRSTAPDAPENTARLAPEP